MNQKFDIPMEAMQRHAQSAAQLMRQLSNENRLLICCNLVAGEMSVTELNARVPALSQSALSQHLAKLREAGMVVTRKEGQTIYYRLTGTDVVQVIGVLQSIYCPEITS